MKEKVHTALKAHFRPEFLNRIDDTIVFHELSREEVILIADMFIARLRDQLAVQGLGLELSAAAQGFLAEKGYDPNSALVRFVAPCSSTSRRTQREDPVQGVPRRSDDRRRHRRRSRRTVLDLRGRRGSAPSVDFETSPTSLRSQPTRSLIE